MFQIADIHSKREIKNNIEYAISFKNFINNTIKKVQCNNASSR